MYIIKTSEFASKTALANSFLLMNSAQLMVDKAFAIV